MLKLIFNLHFLIFNCDCTINVKNWSCLNDKNFYTGVMTRIREELWIIFIQIGPLEPDLCIKTKFDKYLNVCSSLFTRFFTHVKTRSGLVYISSALRASLYVMMGVAFLLPTAVIKFKTAQTNMMSLIVKGWILIQDFIERSILHLWQKLIWLKWKWT